MGHVVLYTPRPMPARCFFPAFSPQFCPSRNPPPRTPHSTGHPTGCEKDAWAGSCRRGRRCRHCARRRRPTTTRPRPCRPPRRVGPLFRRELRPACSGTSECIRRPSMQKGNSVEGGTPREDGLAVALSNRILGSCSEIRKGFVNLGFNVLLHVAFVQHAACAMLHTFGPNSEKEMYFGSNSKLRRHILAPERIHHMSSNQRKIRP